MVVSRTGATDNLAVSNPDGESLSSADSKRRKMAAKLAETKPFATEKRPQSRLLVSTCHKFLILPTAKLKLYFPSISRRRTMKFIVCLNAFLLGSLADAASMTKIVPSRKPTSKPISYYMVPTHAPTRTHIYSVAPSITIEPSSSPSSTPNNKPATITSTPTANIETASCNLTVSFRLLVCLVSFYSIFLPV